MRRMTQRVQRACHDALRPVAALARKLLTPPTPPLEFGWQPIVHGPAEGTELLLPQGTPIAAAITSGAYEARVLSLVAALVSAKDCCFDIGGHYGYYTMALARLAPAGQVHTFEPVARHAERIQQAAARSRLAHVTVHDVAMAEKVGEMPLHYSEGGLGDDSMAYLADYGGVDTPSAREHYPKFSQAMVRTVTLDSLLAKLPLPRFIKIDAEGAEGPILRGGLALIAQAQPRLLVEVHGIPEALECAEILDTAGYQAILLTDQKEIMPVLWAPRDDEDALACVRRMLKREPTVLFARTSPDRARHQA